MPITKTPTMATETAWSTDHERVFQLTTWRHTSGTESRYTVTAAATTATAAPNPQRTSVARSDHASQATSAPAGSSAVGFASAANISANPAIGASSRRRSSKTTTSAVNASATRSGFNAGPQIIAGAGASHPAVSAAAASRPAERALTNTMAATASVAAMLAARPVMNGSTIDARWKYSGGELAATKRDGTGSREAMPSRARAAPFRPAPSPVIHRNRLASAGGHCAHA